MSPDLPRAVRLAALAALVAALAGLVTLPVGRARAAEDSRAAKDQRAASGAKQAASPVTPAAKKPFPLTVAVADLSEVCTYTRRRVGARAANWVQADLAADGWQLVPRAEVRASARDLLAVDPVLAVDDLQRLADRVGAQLIVSGVVAKTSVSPGGEDGERGGTVSVEVRLELTEAQTGELVASGSGRGTARADKDHPVPTDLLVEEALRDGVKAALAWLVQPAPLQGKVLARTGTKTLLISLGSKAGLRKGRVLLVRVRDGEDQVLGVAEVTDLKSDRATVTMVAAAGSEHPRLDDLAIVP